jgi:lipopolysaccharide transport system ATP-binding protein
MELVADKYLTTGVTAASETNWPGVDAPGNDKILLKRVAAFAKGKKVSDPIKSNEEVLVEIEFENKINNVKLDVTWDIFDAESVHLCHVGTLVENGSEINPGNYKVQFTIPANLLNTKRYYFNVLFGIDQRYVAYKHDNVLSIDIEDGLDRQGSAFHQFPGIIHPKLNWKTEKIN